MDDTAARRYFTQPTHVYYRRYEALRAVIVDGRSQKEVADELGFQYHSLRQLVYDFRHSFDARQAATESPFFAMPVGGIATPPAGDFLIQIFAQNLLSTKGQDFAMVVTGDLKSAISVF